jgi:hypothetical protein
MALCAVCNTVWVRASINMFAFCCCSKIVPIGTDCLNIRNRGANFFSLELAFPPVNDLTYVPFAVSGLDDGLECCRRHMAEHELWTRTLIAHARPLR